MTAVCCPKDIGISESACNTVRPIAGKEDSTDSGMTKGTKNKGNFILCDNKTLIVYQLFHVMYCPCLGDIRVYTYLLVYLENTDRLSAFKVTL